MSIETRITIQCDGPQGTGCPIRSQFRPRQITPGAGRDEARQDAGWLWNYTMGDLCPDCTKEARGPLPH